MKNLVYNIFNTLCMQWKIIDIYRNKAKKD